MSDHITLASGHEINLDRPDFVGVSLETFGLMLYRQLRYNGATVRPYCVLEHTIRGVRTCLDPELSPGLGAYAATAARYFLAHDMHEIVTGDIASPVIRAIGKEKVGALKDRLDAAIFDRFGLDQMPDHIAEAVGAVDQVMFQREWMDLMPTSFDRAAPGGCHDGPVRNFMFDHKIYPLKIDTHHRRSAQDMVGEFCHLWRIVRR